MAGKNQQEQTSGSDRPKQPAPELPDRTLGLLFERSPDAIFLVDDDVLVDCNQAAIDMLRYSGRSELLAATPADLSPQFQPCGRSSPVMAS
jgi:PAS domain-containing protein